MGIVGIVDGTVVAIVETGMVEGEVTSDAGGVKVVGAAHIELSTEAAHLLA